MQPVDVGPPPPAVDADAAAAAVADVLGRPEYADLEPGLLDRVVGALLEGFGRLVATFTGTATGSVIGWGVLALLLVVAAVLAVRAVRGLRGDAVASAAATADDVGRTPDEWLADAAAHEEAGRWRDGVRCRHRALVAGLAAAGRLDEVPGRTAGEYLADLRERAPEAGEPFATATAAFERAWYGSGDVDAADARAVAEASVATLEAAGVRRVEVRR